MLTDNPAAPLILLVEDDDNHAELIQRSFEDSPDEYRLQFADTLYDAREAMQAQPPALVLTDYRLPDGDGSELVAISAGSLPVIMMTSYGNEQVAVCAMKTGVRDYIVKSPDTFANLPRTVSYELMRWDLDETRRRTSEAVFRAKRDWERTFDAVPDLITIIDTDCTITRANRAMAERCGVKPGALIGRKCHEVLGGVAFPHDGCPHSRMILDGLVHNIQIKEKRLNGHFDITVSPVYDEEGRISAFVHIMRDISEQIRAEEERRRLEQKFQQTQKLESLGVLAGGIAHDFNNILTIILGHCYIVKEEYDPSDSRKSHVVKIESAANRAADLCRQMLTYAGNSPLKSVRINLHLLIDELVRMLQSAIKKNVVIQLDLDSDLPDITGDNAQIQQVFMNLVINAAEAIGDRNGTINITLRKLTVPEDQPVKDFMGNIISAGCYGYIEISDTGCGMDIETQKRIFEPFYTTKFTGRGLGMSAVLGIVKSHDGALQLSSTPGVGTTFKIYFPLPEKTESAETTKITGYVPLATSTGNVLLVEDEEALRKVGSALLGAMGYSVVTACNGREALQIFRERGIEIDMILLDMIMPEMGGIDTYHELRKIDPLVPIVICSGYGVDGILNNIDADKNLDSISKPYRPDQLQSIFRRLLDNTGVQNQC